MNWLWRRLKILTPVILVLMMFTGAIWFVIERGADSYLSFSSEADVNQKMHIVQKESEMPHLNPTEFQNSVQKHFSFEESEVQLLVLDEESEILYHSSRRNYRKDLASELISAFLGGQISDRTASIDIDGDIYKAAVFDAETINVSEENPKAVPGKEREKKESEKKAESIREKAENSLMEDGSVSNEEASCGKNMDTESEKDGKVSGEKDTGVKQEDDPGIRSGRYYILYKRVENAEILLRRMRYYILLITAPMLLLAAVSIFLVSDRMEKRERALERQREHEKMLLEAKHEKERLAMEVEKERAENLARTHKEREKLFRDISHDLRTPLVSIIGYADGIERGIITEPERAAQVIVREGKRIQRLLESSLTLSKLDAGAWPLNRVRLSLNELIAEQVEVLSKLDETKILVFEEEAEGSEEIRITTDPDLLIRIIQNLVSDCMRYAENEVEIAISVKGAESVLMTISDDGPGIDEEDLPHMFELYYKGKDGKYGIGLSVVAGAVRYLGGDVTVKNKDFPQHGALYSLELPFDAIS